MTIWGARGPRHELPADLDNYGGEDDGEGMRRRTGRQVLVTWSNAVRWVED